MALTAGNAFVPAAEMVEGVRRRPGTRQERSLFGWLLAEVNVVAPRFIRGMALPAGASSHVGVLLVAGGTIEHFRLRRGDSRKTRPLGLDRELVTREAAPLQGAVRTEVHVQLVGEVTTLDQSLRREGDSHRLGRKRAPRGARVGAFAMAAGARLRRPLVRPVLPVGQSP